MEISIAILVIAGYLAITPGQDLKIDKLIPALALVVTFTGIYFN